MPSLTLRITAACCFLAVLLPALAFPAAGAPAPGLYTILVKGIGGSALAIGGAALAVTLEHTLLRAGGNSASKLLYLSIASLSAIGVAHGLSGVYPVNVPVSAIVFLVIALAAGVAWVRFYHAARV